MSKNDTLTPDELCLLVDEHFSTLVLFARQWTVDEAEDLVQDAFLQLVKRSYREGKPAQPVAWLFQVVRNGAIDRIRRNKRRVDRERTFATEQSVRFESPDDGPFRSEEIPAMLDVLSSEQREIVVARIWGGLTFDEIAVVVRLPRTTVFRHYTEALQNIRTRFSEQEP